MIIDIRIVRVQVPLTTPFLFVELRCRLRRGGCSFKLL